MAVRVTRVHLVRHGRAAAGWDTDPDPGLDRIGSAQADAVADRLAPLGPLAMVSSPLLRCRETAAPLAARWSAAVMVEPGVAEIPSPEGVAMGERVDWLRAAMSGTWTDLGPRYTAFRDGVVAAITGLAADSVVFSHFVAINAVIGAAIGDDRLVIRSLDNCSVTVVDVVDGRVHLVEGGHEADTLIR
ncbi:MAG: phosphoglycerate mutase family protein [Acidobacteria bacterium]|nr:phosphoglycerate mutase family protein [Acidobacteriota bacterium]